ncbi:helix-turn-helix domain-containing protein [Streptomyces sp. NPDC001177]
MPSLTSPSGHAAEPATRPPYAPLTKPRLIPPSSAKVFTGPYARQRLSRCLAVQSHPTLTEAARDLGIHHSTLAIQLNRLEADLGHPLFE